MTTLKTLPKPEFKRLFPKTANTELSKKYGVVESTIRTWASILGLSKENYYWTKKQETFLLKNYGKLPNRQIAEELGHTYYGVINKHRELIGLRQSGGRKKVSKLKSK